MGEIQSFSTNRFVPMLPSLITLLKNCPTYWRMEMLRFVGVVIRLL